MFLDPTVTPCAQLTRLSDEHPYPPQRPCLFSGLQSTQDSLGSVSCIKGGTIQWMSPEEERSSKKSQGPDRYVLGVTIHGALSGWTLFAPWEALLAIQEVLKGKRSGRSRGEEERHSQMVYREEYWNVVGSIHRAGGQEPKWYPRVWGTWSLSWQSPDVGGIAETDTSGQPNTMVSDSSLYSVPSYVSQAYLQSLLWHVRSNDCM